MSHRYLLCLGGSKQEVGGLGAAVGVLVSSAVFLRLFLLGFVGVLLFMFGFVWILLSFLLPRGRAWHG